MADCEGTPSAEAPANGPASTPIPSSHRTSGSFTTPVNKRRRGECSDTSSESRDRFKRRQLSLASPELRQKEEKLQKLRLVSHYRQHHSLSDLSELTRCWREAAQQALGDLQQRLEERGQKTDMKQLLTHLGIEPGLVRYDAEQEEFGDADGDGT